MKEDLKNIFLMGLGAMSLTTDKATHLKEELLNAGTKLYNEGLVKNEELKHNIEEKIKENVTIKVEQNTLTNKEDVINAIREMSSEEKKELINLLKEQSTEHTEDNKIDNE